MDNQDFNTPVSQNQELPEKEKISDKKWFKITILVVPVLVILLAIAGYFFLIKKQGENNLTNFQNNKAEQSKENIGLFERFPNSSNRGDIAFDQNYIWVANGQGLIRFNKISGEQKIFTETDGLLGNETTGIIKYGDEVWITSQSRGISIFNTKTNSWRYFTTANGLVNDGNLIMKLDGNVLWLATFDGFAKYDFATQKWTSWKEGAGIKFSGVDDFVFNNNFVWIYISPDAYTSGGVLRLDKNALTWTDLQANNQVFSERQLHWPYLNFDGNFLYAMADKKIYRQNIVSGQWDSFEKNDGNLAKFHIGAKKQSSQYWNFNKDGNIELNEGVNRQVITTNQLNQYCPETTHSYNFSGMEEGYSKEFNFDGNILWFGCRQGFASYDLNNKSWSFKETKSNYPAEIYNILAVKNGELLVDSSLGLGLVAPEKQKWTFIKSLEASDSLWGSAVWIGDDIYFVEILEAFGMGGPSEPPRLWKYNITSKLTNQIKTPDNLSLGELVDLKINDNLWFNSGNEIQEFNPSSGEIISYKPEIEQGKYLTIKDIKKKDNILWFVSNLGLGNFDLISKKFEIIGNPSGIRFPEWGLEHLVIVDNKIWTDASDNPGDGLYIYDSISKTWKHLTQSSSQLKFDWVKNLIGTSDYLLMSSFGRVDFSQRKRGDVSVITTAGTYVYEQYGLNIYNVVKDDWRFFTSEDGMLDGEVNNMYLDGNSVWFVNDSNGIWKLNIDQIR